MLEPGQVDVRLGFLGTYVQTRHEKEHPGKIAIRRIDVVDWDSEAVARWLTPGGFALPHVKVYADGKLLLERSGEPHDASALIEELHRVIDAAAE